MLQFSRWQQGLIAAFIALGVWLMLPNFFAEDAKPWGLPDTRITLGLDLQGGSYLLLEVDTDKVITDRVENLRSDMRTTLRGRAADGLERITFSPPTISGNTVTIQIRDAADSAEAERRLDDLIEPVGGIGAVARNARLEKIDDVTFAMTLTSEAQAFYADTAVNDSIEAVRQRIDSLGTTEPIIQRQGDNRLVVQVPGDEDSERLKNIINAEGQLSFHMVDSSIPVEEARSFLPPNRKILPSEDLGVDLVIFESAEVTGDKITDASASPNQDQGGFQVNISFDRDGQRRFYETTRNNVGQLFAIVLDDVIISAPRIQTVINTPQSRITGSFSPQEAADLALLIRAGALPAPLQTIEQRTVGADLGADSVRAGTIALIIGFAGVVIFMAISYGRFGLYADIALIANVVLIAGALSLLGATLTLPGIAGIVLTIGMAVDANVLIFERIREEIKAGKTAVVAVQTGYEKAFSAIFDANLTTFFAAAIMFFMGAGPVRGFAVTLAIGVITSVFTAYVLTRVFTGGYVLNKRPKALTI
ncbi:protein translocase subunit SecD [Parvularcula sp. IMCC14364]|uniref:protein translocase subunit SecD n=1 Tax=Parvularcula sp. IMCC14364 TaxID=3067902 RepID=UPI002741AB2C|nr:protein translocase subunit SecD [Parvularcula sp. IMCC14364]